MKALITATGQVGPFSTVIRDGAGWLTDGPCFYGDGVIGAATVGEWVPPPPTAEQINAPILSTITALESTVTPRRIREAVTTDAGKTWMASIDTQIADLRTKLVK